ncbi:MAG TPA: hypothetical protein ENI88_11000 [Desulfobulbus sp.]|nr:hypothetical protein [Desulfobulbus sp.]
MNIFFYAASPTTAGQKYYQRTLGMDGIGKCIELPAGCEFNTPGALQMNSHDILLLFAAGDEDLRQLQLLADDLEDFQIILILDGSNRNLLDKGYRLKPRLVCQGEQDLSLLEQFLTRICNRKLRVSSH